MKIVVDTNILISIFISPKGVLGNVFLMSYTPVN